MGFLLGLVVGAIVIGGIAYIKWKHHMRWSIHMPHDEIVFYIDGQHISGREFRPTVTWSIKRKLKKLFNIKNETTSRIYK